MASLQRESIMRNANLGVLCLLFTLQIGCSAGSSAGGDDGQAQGQLGWRHAGDACSFNFECSGSLACIEQVCAGPGITIKGIALDASRSVAAPLTGARVELVGAGPASGGAGVDGFGTPINQVPAGSLSAIAPTTTASDGSFAIQPPTMGHYTLYVGDADIESADTDAMTAWDIQIGSLAPIVSGATMDGEFVTAPSWWSGSLIGRNGADDGLTIDVGGIYAL
jgi:hypothetical protein